MRITENAYNRYFQFLIRNFTCMNNIDLKLDEQGRGAFEIMDGSERVAEMRVSISEENLTVFHTEVSPKLQGKGVAGQLLDEMVRYAREHNIKVIPLCQYVRTQFMRHKDKYNDIWNQNWHG